MSKLDENLKQNLLTAARMIHKELVKIQTFIPDAMSPLVSSLKTENAGRTITKEGTKAATTVVDLGETQGCERTPHWTFFNSYCKLLVLHSCCALIRKIGGWYGLCNHNYISRGCPRLGTL